MAARSQKLESQTYGPSAVDDGRDGRECLRIAFQALVSSLGRENGVGRLKWRGSIRQDQGWEWAHLEKGSNWGLELRGKARANGGF